MSKSMPLFTLLSTITIVGCDSGGTPRTSMKNIKSSASDEGTANDSDAVAQKQNNSESKVSPSESSTASAISLASNVVPLEVRLESITSNTSGLKPLDARKASNIYSLAAGKDPYFDKLPVGTTHSFLFKYERDLPEKSISMMIPVISVEVPYQGTERNMWWRVNGVVKVDSYQGNWKLGDKFSKFAKDGYDEQWSFNYVISKVKAAP